jgi:hypothetical protein
MAEINDAAQPSFNVVPFDRDLRALLAAVAALTNGEDAPAHA